MSFVYASTDWVAAAATDLASIGSSINAASAAAAAASCTGLFRPTSMSAPSLGGRDAAAAAVAVPG